MKARLARAVWDALEDFYALTGLRAQAPLEIFWPDFGPWLFGQIIGRKPHASNSEVSE